MRHSLVFAPREGESEAHFHEEMVCDKQGTSREELEMPRCLLFAPHSLLFEPFALGEMGREEEEMRLEGQEMAHDELVAPLDELVMPLDVELAPLSLSFGRLEGQGMGLEEVFGWCKAPSGWEGDGGKRLAGFVVRRLAPAFFDI